jgi:hypothetical protein
VSATRRPTFWDDGIPLGLQRSATFLVGLALVIYEALLDDPSWIIVSAALGMLGLPWAQRADALRRALTEGDEPR